MRRSGKSGIDRVLVAAFLKECLVAGIFVMDGGCAGRERFFGGDDRRQSLVVDLDQLGGVFRLVMVSATTKAT